MNLNPEMLVECRDVIYTECDLPESNKEPVHLAVKYLMALEFSYKDFMSKEMAGEVDRVFPVLDIIMKCGGKSDPFLDWFLKYEKPEAIEGMEAQPKGAWGT